jgi:hypothetical protein
MEQPGMGPKANRATKMGIDVAVGLTPIGPLNTLAGMLGYSVGNMMTEKGTPAMPTSVMGPSTSDYPARSSFTASAAAAPAPAPKSEPEPTSSLSSSTSSPPSLTTRPLYSFQHEPRVTEEFLGRNRQAYYESLIDDPTTSPTMRAWAMRMSAQSLARGGRVKSPGGTLSRVAAPSSQPPARPLGALARMLNNG